MGRESEWAMYSPEERERTKTRIQHQWTMVDIKHELTLDSIRTALLHFLSISLIISAVQVGQHTNQWEGGMEGGVEGCWERRRWAEESVRCFIASTLCICMWRLYHKSKSHCGDREERRVSLHSSSGPKLNSPSISHWWETFSLHTEGKL